MSLNVFEATYPNQMELQVGKEKLKQKIGQRKKAENKITSLFMPTRVATQRSKLEIGSQKLKLDVGTSKK